MLPIEPLGLSANQWQFLSDPDKYVEASAGTDRKLVLESTRRQFRTVQDILTRLNGSHGQQARRGILLADDVGLGKTTVASLVAWVVASAGDKRVVRILAPNDVMMRRWGDELTSHVEPLQECAPALDVRANQVKARRARRLSAGSIQVVKHSYAAMGLRLTCDLLIIDEAHRAKGDNTAFSRALKQQKKFARRILILTATPFSVQIEELQRMLLLIGGDTARVPVRSFSRALDDLYSGDTARSPELVAERLARKAKAAVDAFSPFVIRNGIDDLPKEHGAFGGREEWNIEVPPASDREVELMLRMERALRVAKHEEAGASKVTNDPRFHVGWRHFDHVTEDLNRKVPRFSEPAKVVIENQLKSIKRVRKEVGVHHSKMEAVASAVKSTIQLGEKVLLFCHHHATAQELTIHLSSTLPNATPPRAPAASVWKAAWDEVLARAGENHHQAQLRETFINWLCADLIRSQVWSWLPAASTSKEKLVEALKGTSARTRGSETVARAAQLLYDALLRSKSSRAVLKEAGAESGLELLPGANGTSRVLGVCEPSGNTAEVSLFIHNQQPDTVISIFNSPFGPDVLVVTDKLSEGIDLHRYCCSLIHYELDPSPIRTVQRNGRLRRVNSWAAITNQPIRYAYPAFRGTRDHRLVQIMKKRIDTFSLLLGGVQDINVDEVRGSDEEWRSRVIKSAKARLAAAGKKLGTRER
jgi:ERCC4-related helicase